MEGQDLVITGGKYSGHSLKTPSDRDIRPLRSRVRRSLFDRLGDAVQDARIFDGFAGTGAVGLEAISRGASHCLFVDNSDTALELIRTNIDRLGVSDACARRKLDLLDPQTLKNLPETKQDLYFLTPPYDVYRTSDGHRHMMGLIKVLAEDRFLQQNGRIILECPADVRIGKLPDRLRRGETETFGITKLVHVNKHE